MTGKRFYINKSGDFEDTKTGNIIVDFGYSLNGLDCKMILDLLNQLNDENEQLKKEEKKLYKYFRKCFDNVSEHGFRETWEIVKK